MGIFVYGDKETALLSKRDERLGAYIKHRGFIERELSDSFFGGLCYNIINQQLSMKACDTLCKKIRTGAGEFTPEIMSDALRLRECGLSQSKAQCIAAVSQMFINGTLSDEKAEAMSDKELCEKLCSVKGIGGWTVEMTLIFCLGRRDVLSLADFGIRKGLSVLHGEDPKNPKALEKYKKLYSPYGTVASLYLWEIARLSNEEMNAIAGKCGENPKM